MLHTLLNYAGGVWVMRALLNILQLLIFNKRIYRSPGYGHSMTLMKEVLQAISSLPCCLKLGEEPWKDCMVPMYMVSLRPFTLVISTVELGGLANDVWVTVTVLRIMGSAPVVPDYQPLTKAESVDVPTIDVLERVNDYTEESKQRVSSDRVSKKIYDSSLSVAKQIAEEFRRGGRVAMVCVFHGSPGCGKSTAIRMLAHELKMKLYNDYDATDCRMSMSNILVNSVDNGLVIGFEEFDVALSQIMSGKVRCYESKQPDATDKASWNKLIDRFRWRTNVIMVCTTNDSLEELYKKIDGDTSMLRDGRIDKHFVWGDGMSEMSEMSVVRVIAPQSAQTAVDK